MSTADNNIIQRSGRKGAVSSKQMLAL